MVNIAPYTTTYETQGFCCYLLHCQKMRWSPSSIDELTNGIYDDVCTPKGEDRVHWQPRYLLRMCECECEHTLKRRATIVQCRIVEKVQDELSFFWNRWERSNEKQGLSKEKMSKIAPYPVQVQRSRSITSMQSCNLEKCKKGLSNWKSSAVHTALGSFLQKKKISLSSLPRYCELFM